MIGVIIGSGIFQTPAAIAKQIDSPVLVLALWALGGVICLCGALTYAELAAKRPAAGGVYVFLREGYGSAIGFVFGWSYLLLIKPFAAGGICFIFATHLNQLLGTAWDPRVIVTIMLLGLTFINIRGVGLSTAIATVLTLFKFGALAAIVLLTLALSKGSWSSMAQSAAPISGVTLWAAIIGAMAGILWTYDGWADVGAVAGEVRDPKRTLPRIYIGGTLAIIALYLLVNMAYFMLVPLPELRALANAKDGFSVAPLVMERLVGPVGSTAVIVIVLLSTLGSSHSSIMTGARVSFAQARDGLLFRFLGHVHPKYATPDVSLIAQVLLAIVAVWVLGSFQSLMESFVFTMWIFHALAGAAIFLKRARETAASEQPFRCPGYPVVPAVFVLSSISMVVLMIVSDPRSTLPWVAVLVAGLPVYWLWRKFSPPAAASTLS